MLEIGRRIYVPRKGGNGEGTMRTMAWFRRKFRLTACATTGG